MRLDVAHLLDARLPLEPNRREPRRVPLEHPQRHQVQRPEHVRLFLRRERRPRQLAVVVLPRRSGPEPEPFQNLLAVPGIPPQPPGFEIQPPKLRRAQPLKRPLDETRRVDPPETRGDVLGVDVVPPEDDEQHHHRGAHRDGGFARGRRRAHREPQRRRGEGLQHDGSRERREALGFGVEARHRVDHGAEREGEEGARGELGDELREEVGRRVVPPRRALAIHHHLLARERGDGLHQRRHRRVDGGHLEQAEPVLDRRLRQTHLPEDGPKHQRAVQRSEQTNRVRLGVAPDLAERAPEEEEKLTNRVRLQPTIRGFLLLDRLAASPRLRLRLVRLPREEAPSGLRPERRAEKPRDAPERRPGSAAALRVPRENLRLPLRDEPRALPRPRVAQPRHPPLALRLRLRARVVDGDDVHHELRGVTVRGDGRPGELAEPPGRLRRRAAVRDAPLGQDAHVVEQSDDRTPRLVHGSDHRHRMTARATGGPAAAGGNVTATSRDVAEGFHHALGLERV